MILQELMTCRNFIYIYIYHVLYIERSSERTPCHLDLEFSRPSLLSCSFCVMWHCSIVCSSPCRVTLALATDSLHVNWNKCPMLSHCVSYHPLSLDLLSSNSSINAPRGAILAADFGASFTICQPAFEIDSREVRDSSHSLQYVVACARPAKFAWPSLVQSGRGPHPMWASPIYCHQYLQASATIPFRWSSAPDDGGRLAFTCWVPCLDDTPTSRMPALHTARHLNETKPTPKWETKCSKMQQQPYNIKYLNKN